MMFEDTKKQKRKTKRTTSPTQAGAKDVLVRHAFAPTHGVGANVKFSRYTWRGEWCGESTTSHWNVLALEPRIAYWN